MKEKVNKNVNGPDLKLVQGTTPHKLIPLNNPDDDDRHQYSMSFKGNLIYSAENGLVCNRASSGFLNLSPKMQHDCPQTLLFCTKSSSNLDEKTGLPLYPILCEITVTSRDTLCLT